MPRLKTETIGTGDQSWLGSDHAMYNARSGTLDVSAFTANTHYPNGYFPSGLALALLDNDLYGPFTAEVNEVQTLNLGGATAGTITITFDGETTAAIAYNANAAAVQAALEALSNINAGDVTVSGGPLPGTNVVITFTGQYAGTNVPQITVGAGSLTGGAVTIATSTAGSGAGTNEDTLAGYLLTDQSTDGVEDINVPILDHGRINLDKLPITHAADVATSGQFVFVTKGSGV